MLFYPLVLAVSFTLYGVFGQYGFPVFWQYTMVLLPVVPAIIAMRAFAAAIGTLDELQRRIHLEALAFSLGGTILCVLTLGFLELGGFVKLNMVWLIVIAIGLWGIGLFLSGRRYR